MLRETGKRSGVCAAQVIIFFTKQLCAFSRPLSCYRAAERESNAPGAGGAGLLIFFFFPFFKKKNKPLILTSPRRVGEIRQNFKHPRVGARRSEMKGCTQSAFPLLKSLQYIFLLIIISIKSEASFKRMEKKNRRLIKIKWTG